jgi:hypothetical protein
MASVNAVTSSITAITDATGTNQTRSTAGFTIPAGATAVLPGWNYNSSRVSGDAVYTINGGSEISFGAPIFTHVRTGNSDRMYAFVARNVSGGTCVISLKNCQYDVASPIIIDAKANCKILFGAKGEGNGTTALSGSATPLWPTAIPGSITPLSSSAVAIGLMTHNTDSGVPTLSEGSGWTLRHKQQDYDGAHQPGLCQYIQMVDESAVASAPTISQALNWLAGLLIIEDTPEIYLVMGGTIATGYFGDEGGGGADSIDDIVFPTEVLVGQGVSPQYSIYGHDPSTSRISDTSSNTWDLSGQIGYGGGVGASLTAFSSILDTEIPAGGHVRYDATALSAGDNGRYGQAWAYVIEKPDTVNGWITATVVTRSQTSTTSVDPGGVTPFEPDTNFTFVSFLGNNRGHVTGLGGIDDLKPFTFPTGWNASITHTQINANGPHSAVHNSTTQSGWAFGFLLEDYADFAPTFGFSIATSEAHSMLIGFNILGGELQEEEPQEAFHTGSGGIVFSGTVTPVKGRANLPTGGVVYSGAVTALRGRSVTPSDGVTFSGAVTPVRGRVVPPVGGVVFSGSGNFVRTINVPSPSGGVVFAGTATGIRGAVRHPIGGMVWGGIGQALRGRVAVPLDGLVFGGAAVVIGDHIDTQDLEWTPSGGLVFAGTGTPVRGRVVLPESGLIFSNSAGVIVRGKVVLPATGGITYAGSVTALRGGVVIPVGGYIIEGTIVPIRGRAVSPSGGVVYSGSADVGSGELVHWIPMGGISFEGSALGIRGKVHHVTGGWVWGGTATVEALSAGQSPIDATMDARINYGLIIHRIRRKV